MSLCGPSGALLANTIQNIRLVLLLAEFFAALPDGTDATMMTVNGRVSPRHVICCTSLCNHLASLT
jgi:hypothetical protein